MMQDGAKISVLGTQNWERGIYQSLSLLYQGQDQQEQGSNLEEC